nr:hypothetical protein CFP56_06347 [Quercus suber]
MVPSYGVWWRRSVGGLDWSVDRSGARRLVSAWWIGARRSAEIWWWIGAVAFGGVDQLGDWIGAWIGAVLGDRFQRGGSEFGDRLRFGGGSKRWFGAVAFGGVD